MYIIDFTCTVQRFRVGGEKLLNCLVDDMFLGKVKVRVLSLDPKLALTRSQFYLAR